MTESRGLRRASGTSARAKPNSRGKDVQHDVREGLGLGRDVLGDRWKPDAHAGAAQVDRTEAEEQGHRGHELEIHDGLEPHATDLARVRVPRHAHHEGREQQRRDDGLDQSKEHKRQHSQVHSDGRQVVTELGAGRHGHEDPRGQRAACHRPGREQGDGEPAKRQGQVRSDEAHAP